MLRAKFLLFLLCSCIGFFIFSPLAAACTGIQLKAKDGAAINGRTVEFAAPIQGTIFFIPRNYSFKGTLPDGQAGLTYSSKYAAIGMNMFNAPAISDGMNEAGLSVGTFYFPDYAGYVQINDQNKNRALSPVEFTNWLVTQFATVDEVKKALAANQVVIAPTKFPGWGFVPPFHYIVYDKSGNSIVIEPVNGKLVVHDDAIGVITNSPTFDWHMTNMRNYISLSTLNVPQIEVKGVMLKQFGQGNGLHGLPGDFSPPSRFVRAAIFSSTAVTPTNAQAAVYEVFHLLNQFDIPMGAVKDMEKNGFVNMDFTVLTTVKDPQNLRYYFRTYDDQNLSMVDLKAFDWNAKNTKTIEFQNAQQTVKDISPQAK